MAVASTGSPKISPQLACLGTLSLLAGLDLVTGEVHGIIRDRHRSREFIELLEKLHAVYPADWIIRVLCDNHSAHTSLETRGGLLAIRGGSNSCLRPSMRPGSTWWRCSFRR